MSVYNVTAQWSASFEDEHILNFRVMAVRDTNLQSHLLQNIYLSDDF